MATSQGMVKRTSLSAFAKVRKSGIVAMTLREDDELIEVLYTERDEDIFLVTAEGMSIHFNEKDVRPMGRTATGVRAIKLEDDDEVVSMCLGQPGVKLLAVTEKGFGKRTPIEDYKVQARGGKGLLTYDKAKFKKTGKLIGAMVVDDDDELLMINSNGVIIRIKASDVSVLGRATQGVKIMKVDEGNSIISMAKVVKEDEEKDDQISMDIKPEK
jgi:DNA gyrase subunit A